MLPNMKAFLDTIAYSELGPALIAVSDNGYNVLVGSTPSHPLLFDSYDDHPRVYNKQMKSTAAGRYQLLARWYDPYKKLLNLTDFSPESQDRIAIQQIKERKALPLIDNGQFYSAIFRCKNIWASFPGAGYGQHENNIENLRTAYESFGGTVSEN